MLKYGEIMFLSILHVCKVVLSHAFDLTLNFLFQKVWFHGLKPAAKFDTTKTW